MLSSALNSPRAIQVNIAIMRAFVELRSHAFPIMPSLPSKLEEMEKKYDAQFRAVFDAIRQLMTPPAGASQADRVRSEGERAQHTAGKQHEGASQKKFTASIGPRNNRMKYPAEQVKGKADKCTEYEE